MKYLFRFYRNNELINERTLSADDMVRQLAKVSVLLTCGTSLKFHEEFDDNYNIVHYQVTFKSSRGEDIMHRYIPQ